MEREQYFFYFQYYINFTLHLIWSYYKVTNLGRDPFFGKQSRKFTTLLHYLYRPPRGFPVPNLTVCIVFAQILVQKLMKKLKEKNFRKAADNVNVYMLCVWVCVMWRTKAVHLPWQMSDCNLSWSTHFFFFHQATDDTGHSDKTSHPQQLRGGAVHVYVYVCFLHICAHVTCAAYMCDTW